MPVIETNGCYVKIATQEHFTQLSAELAAINDWNGEQAARFAGRWLDFTKYRTLPVVTQIGVTDADYQI